MKTKLIIIAAALLLSGCAEHPTLRMVETAHEKYPGCEIRGENAIVATLFVRTASGEVRRIVFGDDQKIITDNLIFPSK